MTLKSLPMLCAGLMAVGCNQSNSKTRIEQAMDLAEGQTGQRPPWTEVWDAAPPIWEEGSVLTQEEAVALALRNNRQLRADLETIAQADAQLLQAGLLSNPMLNLMIMFPAGGGRSMLWANGLPQMPLQDLWLIPARKKVAKAELQSAVLRVADGAVGTAASVKTTYARLQYLQRAIELTRENLEIVRQSTEVIRVRQTSGQATQVQTNLSDIRAMRMKSELIGMESEYRAGKRELLATMGLASASADWIVEPLAPLPEEWLAQTDEEQLTVVAADQRLDLKAAEWEIQAAQAEIGLNKREGWPDLALGLGFQRDPAPQSNNPSWAGRAGNTAVRGLVDRAMGMPSAPMLGEPFQPKMREVKWSVGPMMEMELPIFDWNQAGIARARATHRQRIANYEALLQQTIETVRRSLVTLKQAHEQSRFYAESVTPAVEQNLELARRSYISGQEDLTVYLDVQEDLLRTRLSQIEFTRNYLVSRAELERALGGKLVAEPVADTRPEP